LSQPIDNVVIYLYFGSTIFHRTGDFNGPAKTMVPAPPQALAGKAGSESGAGPA
jgi:hypothetical protein